MDSASRFRVVVAFTSALLCHTRCQTVDYLSQNTARHLSRCGFLQTSVEIGSITLEINWNELVRSILVQ